jgi:succinate dehydrogenase / fumarate reductase cytochrome b subunit
MKYSALPIFSTTIGKKILMALSGLFLCTFLVVHLIGNLQLFKDDNGFAFNHYAHFMTTNPLIKTVSYVNYALILLHVFTSLFLTLRNRKARPVNYSYNNPNAGSIWSSRNMGILGTIILVFIVVHMQNFWYEYKFGEVPVASYYEYIAPDGKSMTTDNIETVPSESYATVRMLYMKDLYKEVVTEFSEEALLVLLYVLAQAAIAFHLWHGFSSAFQTLGMNHKKYTPLIKNLGYGFAVIIPLLFATMPLYFYFIHK